MPCYHKFSNDLQLEYVNWEVRTLFIGTFNPGWHARNNNANWFYGRTAKNEFWCILPKIHEGISLLNGNRSIWIEFCKRNHIAVTDVLSSLDNADGDNLSHKDSILGFKDDELGKFENTKTDIGTILQKFPSIQQICITRKTLPEFWVECFKPTIDWINLNQNRNISITYLRSPSRGARKGIVGNFCDFVSNSWLETGYQIL